MTLLQLVESIFSFLKNWSQVILIGVGSLAFFVYIFQKRDKKRSAATEIKEQILEIEDWIQNLRNKPLNSSHNIYMYQLGPILTENLWQKNRSILSQHLSEEDRRVIQRFYTAVEKVERARLDIVKCLTNSWNHKADIEQHYIGEHHMQSSTEEEAIEEFYNKINSFINNTNVFVPGICIEILKSANEIQMLSGTTAYQKLVKLSH